MNSRRMNGEEMWNRALRELDEQKKREARIERLREKWNRMEMERLRERARRVGVDC